MDSSLVKSQPQSVSAELVKRGPSSTFATGRAIATRVAGDALPRYVTAEQVAAALAGFEPLDPRGLFLLALWQTGARVSELLAAKVGDLNFADGTIRLRTLKRRGGAIVYRLVPIQQDLLGQLAQYINAGVAVDRRNRSERGSGARLWPRTRQWAHDVVQKAFSRSSVDRGLAHPHAFRHGHGVHALKAGVPITAVQETMGHASIQTTALYGRLSLVDRRRAYAGANFEVRR